MNGKGPMPASLRGAVLAAWLAVAVSLPGGKVWAWSWCACLPELDAALCGAEPECASLLGPLQEAERLLQQECLPDSECKAMLDNLCSQACSAFKSIDQSIATQVMAPEPTVRRPPPREPSAKKRSKEPKPPASEEDRAKAEKEKKDEAEHQAECQKLKAYAKSGVYKDWALQEKKYQYAQDAARSIRELRDEINSDNWWTLGAIPEIAAAVKVTCTAIETAIAAVSPGGSAVALAEKLAESISTKRAKWGKIFYEWLTTGQDIQALVTSSSDELLLSVALDNLGAVGATLDGLKSIAEDLELARTIGAEKDAYRRTLQEQTARLEREIRRYEANMARAVRSQEIILATQESIQEFCKKKEEPPPVAALPLS